MKYEGDKYVKHFSCWNQLLVMIFGQLSNRNSLRDLTNTISAHSNKSYHLGFGKSITRSNLSKANEKRNPKIFEDFAYHMFDIARKKRIVKDWNWRESVCFWFLPKSIQKNFAGLFTMLNPLHICLLHFTETLVFKFSNIKCNVIISVIKIWL